MRKYLVFVLTVAVLVMLAGVAVADTTAVQAPSISRKGRFSVITIAVTADATGGAVTDFEVDLSSIVDGVGLPPQYLYFVTAKPGAGAASPADGYTIGFTDEDGGTVLAPTACSAATAKAKDYIDASKDLPNYWPATGNLRMAVSDIGANHTTEIKLLLAE